MDWRRPYRYGWCKCNLPLLECRCPYAPPLPPGPGDRCELILRPQTCIPPFLPMPDHPTPRWLGTDSKKQLRQLIKPINQDVPNCRVWSNKDVESYFSCYFNPDIAYVIQQSRITGKELLLLRREDVFDLLGAAQRRNLFPRPIPLIPSHDLTQVWIHVSCLQHRRDAYDLFIDGIENMRSMGTPFQYTLPGDYRYIGHPYLLPEIFHYYRWN